MPWNNDYIRKSRSRNTIITYPRGVGSNLGGLIELSALEELLVLLDVQIIRARKVSPASELEGQFGVI